MSKWRQVSQALVWIGLGFWLHVSLSSLRQSSSHLSELQLAGPRDGAVGSPRGRKPGGSSILPACRPQPCSWTWWPSGRHPPPELRLEEIEAAANRKEMQLAERLYERNLHRRDRVFGADGWKRIRKKGLPATLSKKARLKWHPSAFVLEYYRPLYPCFNEERFGLWNGQSRWVCRPNQISRETLIYTFGSDEWMWFEVELYRRYQPAIHAYNPGIPEDLALKFATREEFQFHNAAIDSSDHGAYQTFQTMLQENGHTYVDIVKLDCGGCEARVLLSLLQQFHHELPIGQIVVDIYGIANVTRMDVLLRGLEKGGFRAFHMEQNWRFMDNIQMSFIHKDLCGPQIQTREEY